MNTSILNIFNDISHNYFIKNGLIKQYTLSRHAVRETLHSATITLPIETKNIYVCCFDTSYKDVCNSPSIDEIATSYCFILSNFETGQFESMMVSGNETTYDVMKCETTDSALSVSWRPHYFRWKYFTDDNVHITYHNIWYFYW